MASSQALKTCKDELRDPERCLQIRDRVSEAIKEYPYCLPFYRERAWVYEALGYPDLAVMDFYKALLLLEELDDEDAEFHEQASHALQMYLQDPATQMKGHRGHTVADFRDSLPPEEAISLSSEMVTGGGMALAERIRSVLAKELPLDIVSQLALIGCFRTAAEYLQKARAVDANNPRLSSVEAHYRSKVTDFYLSKESSVPCKDDGRFDANNLWDAGLVRREVYPWNKHEQDRHSESALELLNGEMSKVAPDMEVKVTDLPALTETAPPSLDDSAQKQIDELMQSGDLPSYNQFLRIRPLCNSEQDQPGVSRQLGVFARRDLVPNQIILHERSLLTASTRLHEALCDACGSALPPLSQISSGAEDSSKGSKKEGPVECSDCDDTIFCTATCLDLASDAYHTAVCGADGIDAIVKDVPGRQAADALYTQLLFRALAMSLTQEVHALDLKEVKYIWGDFERPTTSLGYLPASYDMSQKSAAQLGELRFTAARRTLPFSFESNILQPIHFLTLLDRSVFEVSTENHEAAELWVWNTLLAKFRGTASARISERDGRPEVAAVHPMWCLVNHSCDPAVSWEWAGDIEFKVRQQRKAWKRGDDQTDPVAAGIKKGQEVLSHYVDIDLDVKERREWGAGALGGACRCDRCQWESCEA